MTVFLLNIKIVEAQNSNTYRASVYPDPESNWRRDVFQARAAVI